MNLYVGNLPFSLGDAELQELFAPFGNVVRARVMLDRETGRSRGFGFVELDDEAAAQAITGRNGFEVDGRKLVVNEARPREERPRSGPREGGFEGGGFGGKRGGGGGERRDFRDRKPSFRDQKRRRFDEPQEEERW